MAAAYDLNNICEMAQNLEDSTSKFASPGYVPDLNYSSPLIAQIKSAKDLIEQIKRNFI